MRPEAPGLSATPSHGNPQPASGAREEPLARWRTLAARVLPPVVVLIVLLVIWQGAIAIFNIQPYILPGPLETVRGGWDARDDLGVALRATFVDSLLGLGLSIVLGLLIAMLIARFKTLERGLLPYA